MKLDSFIFLIVLHSAVVKYSRPFQCHWVSNCFGWHLQNLCLGAHHVHKLSECQYSQWFFCFFIKIFHFFIKWRFASFYSIAL